MANNLRVKENVWQDNLSLFDNWQDKYHFIMEQGRGLSGIPMSERIDSMLVRGCQSQVWMHLEFVDNILNIKAESDALIVRGLIAIIIDIYNKQNRCDILAYDHGFPKRLGLTEHLSPTRANGLYAILKQIVLVTGEG